MDKMNSDSKMRITVFKNGDKSVSCVLCLNHETITELLEDISKRLSVTSVKHIMNEHGAKILNLEALRDGDVVFASQGEEMMQDVKDSSHLEDTNRSHSEWIRLNVGGITFSTTKATLVGEHTDSMLARMFADEEDNHWKSSVDENGAYLIDRSGTYFAPILNYLRNGQLILDENINPVGVLEEAKFFGITSIIPQLEQMVQANAKPDDYTPISRRQLALSLMTTPANCELRCQGLDFTGADLSRLDLRFVNFKYAILKGANLAGANLANVNFERADMTEAILDGANLMGVKMLCAHLEYASMRGCNFEDPAGSKATMEGANMKHVNLEGSHMAGVNLRVATLRNGKLMNCDLRGAILAGADLENCVLSGCDLQEANLRGANLEGASFEQMLNALHMSQTLKS